MSADEGASTLPGGPSDGLLDADRLLERLVELHEASLSWQRCSRLELFHRSSVTLRVSSTDGGANPVTQVGNDEGIAARVERPGERGSFFAASSGCDEAKLRWTLDHALRGRPEIQDGAEGWPSDRATSLIDHDPDVRLPSPVEMGSWLTRAMEAAAGGARGRSVGEVLRGWVEAALTVESWVAEMGMRSSRRRLRAWAMVHVREKAGAERVLPVASRTWKELPPEGWARLMGERGVPRRRRRVSEPGKTTVMFTPETSAALIAALTRSVHLGPQETGFPVGPGWSLTDDPQHPEALSGGLFDDAGFYTASTRLASGGDIVGNLNGEGHFRRSSFRDRPSAHPAHLVVDCQPRKLPDRGLLVSDLRIHPLRLNRWMLEFEAYPLPDGLEADARIVGHAKVAPRQLLWHCAACLEPRRFSSRGVSTGSLLFEDLDVA